MPDLKTPLLRLWDAVWTPTAHTMRQLALTAVIANVVIMVTGATVRLTKSGLGCAQWPQCEPGSFVPVEFAGQDLIEFGNRLLSVPVGAVGLACLIAAVRLAPRRAGLIWLAAIQPFAVVLQAAWGGLTVLSGLNPAVVAGHFMLSIGLLAAATALHMRSQEGDGPPRRLVHRDIRMLSHILVASLLALLVAGTVVTGSGPHGGDVAAPRFEFAIETVARLHSDLVWVVVGLTFALLFGLHVTNAEGRARRAALLLLLLELSQGFVGYVQYFTGVPEVLVGLHVLGSALVWIAAVRVVFFLRERVSLTNPRPGPNPLDQAAV